MKITFIEPICFEGAIDNEIDFLKSEFTIMLLSMRNQVF